MKRAQISKPTIDTAQALKFATGAAESKPAPRRRKPAEAATKASASRVFFAPEGDKRLTINMRQELHKKLKMAAVQQDTTVGEILEALVEKHL